MEGIFLQLRILVGGGNALPSAQELYPRAQRFEVVEADAITTRAAAKSNDPRLRLPPGATSLLQPQVIATFGSQYHPSAIPEGVQQAIAASFRNYVVVRAAAAQDRHPGIPAMKTPGAVEHAVDRARWMYPHETKWVALAADRLAPARPADFPGMTLPDGAAVPVEPTMLASWEDPARPDDDDTRNAEFTAVPDSPD